MKKILTITFLTIVMMMTVRFAHAYVTFTGETSGIWANPVYDTNDYVRMYNYDASGSRSYFYYGLGISGSYSSLFTFDGKGSDGDADWVGRDDGQAFLMGEFTYRNGLNYGYSIDGVAGVDLNIAMEIVDPVSLLVNSFDYDFSIRTTHNITGNPYSDRDFVSVINSTAQLTYMYNSRQYTLEILGLSQNGGNTIMTDFSANENSTIYAGLYARISSQGGPTPIPEPTSLLLLGSSFLGLIRFRTKIF